MTDSMPELVAQRKFECPACGAETVWNAAKQLVVCPYCGTSVPLELPSGEGRIKEHDLAIALRSLPEEKRGWKAEKRTVKCQSCQAISVFDAENVAQRCDFCGSSQLVAYDQIKPPIQPETLLQFKVAESQVRESIRNWYGGHFWAHSKLKRLAMTDTLHGVYIPYWTFDAQVEADWSAEAGHYYYVSETYRDSNGNVQSRQVQRVRWEPAAGHVSNFFDDELVQGSLGVRPDLLRKVEPFPTQELTPYDPKYLAGWVVEQYQIDLVAAAQHSRRQMDQKLGTLCTSKIPGDTYRNLRVEPDYSGQTFKHILVPIWLLAYTFGAKRFQVVVNGYTGKIAGDYPLDWVKISVAVLIAIFILFLIIFFANS
jgi:transcription elongation factor Elf1